MGYVPAYVSTHGKFLMWSEVNQKRFLRSSGTWVESSSIRKHLAALPRPESVISSFRTLFAKKHLTAFPCCNEKNFQLASTRFLPPFYPDVINRYKIKIPWYFETVLRTKVRKREPAVSRQYCEKTARLNWLQSVEVQLTPIPDECFLFDSYQYTKGTVYRNS